MKKDLKFAPREVFEQILEYAVIPTFDLVIENERGEVLIAKRKIAPYLRKWALPGLRMFKPESIEDTLVRIARDEVGVEIDVDNRIYLGQYVGRFRSEHSRQDLSTGFAVRTADEFKINEDHFSDFRLITSPRQIPQDAGPMYRTYLSQFFAQVKGHDISQVNKSGAPGDIGL